ncbi:baseplate J/gp47 family protein [Tissierella sp. MSJ-40]|uniref:Baseplate J/gp47 family protein n=1 Tax=Tissierella simiarum TaxID=2841534 RepID=A0ABS6EBH8_9FIRM|nr:baseplate J/gp47 family protein [Tissierella simiarum]MBU5440283.1 baseplate J/gp47 family protein [Tissierella simiarum]
MFDGMTFEDIMKRMLDRIPDSFDKRPSSVIYDALAPAAAELAQAYMTLEYIYSKLDVENLQGEELERFVNFRTGIERKKATKAIRKGVFSKADGSFLNVPIGSRFTGENLYYKVTEKIIDGEFKLECEELGEIGNIYTGTLIPVDYIDGLATAKLTDILVFGYDAESDESLLERYFERIRTPATSGNKYHYLNWAKEVVGVGDAKVIPLWNGKGTVKVVIVDSNKNPGTKELIDKVFDHIEEERPIGARVTVVSAIAKDISIKAKVNLAEGYRIQLVQDEFKKSLEKYRKDIAFKDSYISYAAIGSILFNVEGILDHSELKLNEEMKNISLGDEEIPVFNLVELEVI